MMDLFKFNRLTHKIENLIISDIKKREPIKYLLFWIFDLTAKIGFFGFIAFLAFIIFMRIIITPETDIPEYLMHDISLTSLSLILIGLCSMAIRTYFYLKLENITLEYINKHTPK